MARVFGTVRPLNKKLPFTKIPSYRRRWSLGSTRIYLSILGACQKLSIRPTSSITSNSSIVNNWLPWVSLALPNSMPGKKGCLCRMNTISFPEGLPLWPTSGPWEELSPPGQRSTNRTTRLRTSPVSRSNKGAVRNISWSRNSRWNRPRTKPWRGTLSPGGASICPCRRLARSPAMTRIISLSP